MKPKQTTKLGNPYNTPSSAPQWPTISAADTKVIQELLLALLAPIGKYHQQRTEIASLARSRKRKRKSGVKTRTGDVHNQQTSTQPGKDVAIHNEQKSTTPEETHKKDKEEQDKQEPPPIQNYILPGFNSLHRHLTSLAAHSAPSSAPLSNNTNPKNPLTQSEDPDSKGKETTTTTTTTTSTNNTGTNNIKPTHITAIFISSPKKETLFTHLPALVTTASLAHNNNHHHSSHNPHHSYSSAEQRTRIVPLPENACQQLSSALGVARLSCLGLLKGAPGAEGLEQFIVQNIPETKVKWLEDVVGGVYQPLRVEVSESLPKTHLKKKNNSNSNKEAAGRKRNKQEAG